MSGRVGDLNAKQDAALKQLKDNLQDIWQERYNDDYFMLKWLRVSKFDVKKAETMVRNNREWRIKFGVDKLLEWDPPEVIKKYKTGGGYGHDKEGYPIVYYNYGYMDIKGVLYSVSKKDLIKARLMISEYGDKYAFPEISKEQGKRIDQAILIFDMEHIGIKHLWKPAFDLFTETVAIAEANYPDSLRKAYVINAPSIFPVAYNLVKPFLSEATKHKVHVLGSNWKKKLLEDIDADQLPVHWGGTAKGEDGNPYCTPPPDAPLQAEGVHMGGKVPESYYKTKDNFVDMKDFTTVTVNRNSSFHLDYDIVEHNCAIRWQFQTEGNDIGFGLYRRTAEGKQKYSEMEELIPTQRLNSHWVPEEGSYDCKELGIYVVRFDNSYSLVKSKKLSYLIEILKSDIDKMEHEIHMESTDL